MYQPMDYVNYGELGVCQITSIGKHPELDPNQTYYTIKPLERPENTIYLPVEKAVGSRIRKIISPENAMQLLEKIPQLDTIQRANRKETQQALEQSMKTHLCEEWCRVLKTLYPSRVNPQGSNHKRSATEELLWRTAEGCLVGELSFALGESKEDARERLKSCFRHAAFQC